MKHCGMALAAIAAAGTLGTMRANAQALRELTFQVAVPAAKPPVIDGALDDACWAKAPAHTTYYQYYIANPPATNGFADCRLVYDQQGIYVGVRNPEHLIAKMPQKHVKNFDGGLWYDESAELYFDPAAAGVGWYKFIVNCLGKYDTAYQMDPANIDENWTCSGLVSAAKIFDNRWEFELFIPWTAFDNHPPAKPGEIWTFLHARFRWVENPWKDFFASASGAIGGYTPGLFGYLYFSDGNVPDTEKVLSLLQDRVHCRWAVQIDGKTYLHDENGVTVLAESIHAFIARHEAEEKAFNDLCATNIAKLAADPAYKAEPLKMPLAGTYDLDPPKEYNGHNGWFRHNPVRNAYVTPHLEWAPKLFGKRAPRPLSLTGMDTSLREMIELDQRFELADPMYHPGGFGASGHFEAAVTLGTAFDKQRQIETLLARKPDVIAVTRYAFKNIPPRYRYEILRRVRDEGTGLVLLCASGELHQELPGITLEEDAGAALALARRAPYAALPGCPMPPAHRHRGRLPTEAWTRLGHFGKGRVAIAHFPPPPSWSLTWKGMFESRAVYAFNLLRWAQGADFAADVDYGTGMERDAFGPAASFFAFRVDTKGSGINEVRYRVRDSVNRVVYDRVAPLAKGMNTVCADISTLPGGDYYLDVMPRKRGAAPRYDSPSFRPFSKASPTGPLTIDGTNATFVAENSAPRLGVGWPHPLLVEGVLAWELRDLPYNQVRMKGEIPLKAGASQATVTDPAREFPTRAGALRVVISDAKGRALGSGEKVIYFPNHRYPDYTMIMWASVESGSMAELFAPMIVEWMGYDGFVEDNGGKGAAFNAWGVPSVYSLRLAGSEKGTTWFGWMIPHLNKTKIEREQWELLKEDYNIYRPEVRKHVAEAVRRSFTGVAKWAPLVWGLGDESHYSDNLGMGGEQNKGYYRAWLEKRYGSIDRLNRAYKTNLASFAEAPHLTVAEARKAGNLSAWLDNKLYSAHYYADCGALERSVIKQLDGRARVGHEASAGGDLEYTLQTLDFWGPYRNVVEDELTSSVKPNLVRAVWWGGYVRAGRNGFPTDQWEYLLTGTLNGDEWFCGYPGSSESCFAADLTPAPYVQRQHDYHAQLKRGLASLLMRTPLRKHPFAHVYSWASGQISTIDDAFPGGDTLAYIRFCYRHGYGVTLVPASKPGNLDGCKMLFLSGACALSDAEVETIEKFLKGGGTIISDSEPGVLDGFLSRRDKPPFEGRWTKLERGWTDAQMQELLGSIGVTPLEKVEGLDLKHTILRARDTSYTGQAAEVFGAKMTLVGFKTLADYVGRTCALDFGREGFVYETDDRYLGKLSRVDIAAIEKPFKLYSVFEKEQTAPVFSLAREGLEPASDNRPATALAKQGGANERSGALAVSPGACLSFETAPLRPGSTYRLMVKGPDGQEIRNRELVFANDGKVKKHTFQFPYSDKPGAYTAVLRDIATGLETAVRVTVK